MDLSDFFGGDAPDLKLAKEARRSVKSSMLPGRDEIGDDINWGDTGAIDHILQGRTIEGAETTSIRALTDKGRAKGALKLPVQAGTRVTFVSNLGSVLAYEDIPEDKVAGTVVTVRSAQGDVTGSSRGVHVLWDDGQFRAIQAEHLRVAGGSYQEYTERKRREGEKALSKDEWEARVKGTGKADKSPGKADKNTDKDKADKNTDKDPVEHLKESVSTVSKGVADRQNQVFRLFPGGKGFDGFKKRPNVAQVRGAINSLQYDLKAVDPTKKNYKKKIEQISGQIHDNLVEYERLAKQYAPSKKASLRVEGVRIRVASLGDLSSFFEPVLGRTASDSDLVHKATKDLWSFRQDGGEYVIERLFTEDGNPLKV